MYSRLKYALCLAVTCALTLPAASEEVYRDNVVIVLDASGSMRKAMYGSGVVKMDAAKAALKEVLQQVPDTTHIGLLVFSARNVENEWIYELGPRDNEALLAAIDLPQPGGGTPLGRYMKVASDRLLEEREKQFGYGTYRLLIVTDGQASDTGRVEAFTPEIMARGITIDVIGVSMRDRHTLATKVHSYRSADDPDSLKNAVQEVFAEIDSGSGGDTDEEAFALIADLPQEVAEGMLTALATSGNYPIGERPRTNRSETAQAPDRPVQVPRQEQSPPPPTPQGDSTGFKVWQVAVVIMIIVMAIARGNRRSRRRNRR